MSSSSPYELSSKRAIYFRKETLTFTGIRFYAAIKQIKYRTLLNRSRPQIEASI